MATLNTLALGTFTNVNDTTITGAEPVLQEIASASDTTNVHDTANTTHTGVAQFTLEDVNADLGNVDTLFIRLRYANSATPDLNTWDSLSARVFKSDGTTPLTAALTVVSGPIEDTTPINSSVVQFTGVDTAATKDDWNGAVVQLSFAISRVKGGDAVEERVFAAELTGTYTEASTVFTGSASPTQEADTSSASGTFEQVGFPTLAASTVSLETVDTTTHDVDMTGAAAGLLAILFISIDGTSTTLSNIPAGWTLAVDSTGQLTDFNGYVYWKRLTGADASFQYTSSNSEESVNRVWFIDDSSSDPEFGAVWSDADSTTEDPPLLNPAGWGTEKTLWIAWTIRQGPAIVTAYPTDYTANQDTQRSSANASAAADGIASRKLEAASDNPGTFTWDTSNTGVGVTVAVRPTVTAFTGSAAVVQEDDTSTASGTFVAPTFTGTGSPAQADDTAAAAGTFLAPTFTGTASPTQAADTSASSGTFLGGPVTGTAAPTQEADTSTAAGTFTPGTLTGTAAALSESDSSTASGTFTAPVFAGSSAVTQAADTSTASGTFTVPTFTGSVAVVEGDDTSTASGTFVSGTLTGSAAAQQEPDASAAAGTFVAPTFEGTAAGAQDDQTSTATGTFSLPAYAGTVVVTQDDQTSTATGTFAAGPITGTAAPTQADDTSTASGSFTGPPDLYPMLAVGYTDPPVAEGDTVEPTGKGRHYESLTTQ